MVRIQGRGVAGTVAAKVKHLFGLCKEFEEKVRKWRLFLTDAGCFEIQNAASTNQSGATTNQIGLSARWAFSPLSPMPRT